MCAAQSNLKYVFCSNGLMCMTCIEQKQKISHNMLPPHKHAPLTYRSTFQSACLADMSPLSITRILTSTSFHTDKRCDVGKLSKNGVFFST